uniref:EF-hand domain-containing protein n=1 Tax=Arion vulgaris TaxID=1028688 RepID=A0A0B6ZK59_9EUPU
MAGKKPAEVWSDLFTKHDKDKNGTLDKKEVRALLSENGSNLPESEFENFFQFFDGPKGDQKITKDEFLAGLKKIEEFIKELAAVFKQYDGDNSGFLDKTELTKILVDCGHNLKPAEVAEILKKADRSGDGKISFDEFVVAFT